MRESREWVTAVGTGRSTGVKSEAFVSHECKLWIKNPARERVIGGVVY